MTTLVLHPYSPTHRTADQAECWRALCSWPPSGDVVVVHAPCWGEYDYCTWLASQWAYPGDLVVLEHDITLSWEHYLALEACGRDVCAYDYARPDGRSWTTHVDRGYWGAIKLGRAARAAVVATPPVPLVAYTQVAMSVAERLAAPHVHYPALPHAHREP